MMSNVNNNTDKSLSGTKSDESVGFIHEIDMEPQVIDSVNIRDMYVISDRSNLSGIEESLSLEGSPQKDSNEREGNEGKENESTKGKGDAVDDGGQQPAAQEDNKQGGSTCMPVTPLKCKLINSAHRGSLDCLSSSPSPFGQYKGDSSSQRSWISTLRSGGDSCTTAFSPITSGSVGRQRPSPVVRSISYNTGGPSSSNPCTPKTLSSDSYNFSTSFASGSINASGSLRSDERRPNSMERLKRTGNYRPVILKGKEPMKTAFVMGLDQSDTESSVGNFTASRSYLESPFSTLQSSTPNTSNLSSSTLPLSSSTPLVRPQVPPRTKFLSPSERTLERRSDSSGGSTSFSSSGALDGSKVNSCSSSSFLGTSMSGSSSTAPTAREAAAALLRSSLDRGLTGATKGSQLAKLDISGSPAPDEQDQPRTPLKPTMGVSMIGKQRRTPGVLSPREVFFCSPPPSPSPIAPLQNHHHYLPHTTLASTTPGPVLNLPSSISSRVGVAEAGVGRPAKLKNPANAPVLTSSNSSSLNSSLQSNNSSSAGTATQVPSETSSATTVSEYIGPDGKPLQVLPHYPDMEYPPIFEAGSYSIADSVASAVCSPLQSAQPPTSQGGYSHGYTPAYQSRTPTHKPRTHTHAQYYNLQGFNSASLPALPVQEPDYNRGAGGERPPHGGGSAGGSYSSGLSLHIPPPSSCSSLPSPSKPANSPRSGVIVGISCTGGSSVVSHHHNIYVTSPVRPAPYTQRPRLDPPVSSAGSSAALGPAPTYQGDGMHSSTSVGCGSDRATCYASICPGSNNSTAGSTTPSPVHKDSLQQKPVRRRTPPHFPPSQSNSSLESISEHGYLQGGVLSVLPSGAGDPFASVQNSNGGFSSRSSNGGSTTTVLSPLDSTTTLLTGGGNLVTSVGSSDGRNSNGGGMVGSFQHGGSSGGTVLTPQSHRPGQLLGPPRLVLPGPPADPPPDD